MMLWGILIFLLLITGAYVYIRRVPHGWVEFKSGLVLKFLPPLHAKPIPELRKSIELFIAKNAHKLKLPIGRVEDFQIPTRHGGVSARLYDNSSTPADRVIFFIHGGGWCICSIDTHNEQIRRVTRATGLPVIAINYSLAPENKFPIALEECIDAIKWIRENHQQLNCGDRIIAMGDSAGGNLAISSTNELLKEGIQDLVNHVVAVYPGTDCRARSTESHRAFQDGYYLTGQAMDAFASAYIRSDIDREDPRVSPILLEDLKDFPPTFILTAEFDPLRDEGEAFANHLSEAGVKVTVKRYQGAIHGFFGLKDFGVKGLNAVEDVADYLRDA